MVRLHDTAKGEVVELVPRDAGRVSMYVCGPTVYEVPHLGHGRFALVFDVLRRYLEWRGFEVRYVSNITDIDDNIIARAAREDRPWDEVAQQYEAAWYEAMDLLGVKRPTADPHATQYVMRVVELIGELMAAGKAYEAPDGVYLSVGRVEGYGLLARQSLESLRSGARVEPGEGKRSPLDFVLWKKAKPGEPEWPSPWGAGRPGWHTECVVMALDLLGEGFDLHGGGQDLAFPHHENERAQAVALGRRFARHWSHNGWVMVEDEKMSKSLANFTTIPQLLATADPRAYRVLVLQSHYRKPVHVTDDAVAQAGRTLGRLDEFARKAAWLSPAPPDQDVLDRFVDRMDDDLDSPGAMALLFDTVRDANTALASGDEARASTLRATVEEVGRAVGLVVASVPDDDGDLDTETRALAMRRDELRADRDFSAADAIRDELSARGWVVEDTPSGTKLHR